MTTAQTRRDALWDSFVHWTENYAQVCKGKLHSGYIWYESCALCEAVNANDEGCGRCVLVEYGMGCDVSLESPWERVRQPLCGGEQPRKPTEHMALVLCLLYFVEGGA